MNEIDTKTLSFFEKAKENANILDMLEGEKRRYYEQDEAVTAIDKFIAKAKQTINLI